MSTISQPSSDAPLSADDRYTIGVDLGQSHDPTAIAIVRRVDGPSGEPVFQVGHLERIPLNTPYPGVVQHVRRLAARPVFRGSADLVIDFTGVGRPVFDMFEAAGMSPIGVAITSGDAVGHEGRIYKVPKLTLISRLQALLHDGRLRILRTLPEAPALVAELQDFKAEVTDSGYWKFGARAGKHDDLVLATAIAVWRAYGDGISGFGIFEYYRRTALGLPIGAQHAAAAPAMVRMRAPIGCTTIFARNGSRIVPDIDGIVAVPADHEAELRLAGFVTIIAEEAPA